MQALLFFLLVVVSVEAFDVLPLLSRTKEMFEGAVNRMSPAWHEATRVVRDSVENFESGVDLGDEGLCDKYRCCQVSDEESCFISEMPDGETTIVLAPQGSNATCIFGTQYGIQVIPGSSEKVLFYFQGGGACWSRSSLAAGLCTTEISPNANAGVFDKSNEQNPFKDYTVVHALYCSGDVYSGDVTQSYKHMGKPVIQHGVANAQFAVDWAKEQGFGGSDGVLENFVGMGCSAGSVGVQMWADKLLTTFPAETVAIVPDSYAGLFPPNSVGPLMKNYGVCDTDLISPNLKAPCYEGALDIQDVVSSHISAYERSPFAFIQSKVDAVQQSFYVAVGLTTRGESAVITPAKFYEGISNIFSGYNKLPNFITYLIDGPMHCFTNMDVMYKATNAGPDGHRNPSDPAPDDLTLRDWLEQLPLSTGEKASTECAGQVQDSLSVEALSGGDVSAYTYCDTGVVPKTFTQG